MLSGVQTSPKSPAGDPITRQIKSRCFDLRANEHSFAALHRNITALEHLIFAQDSGGDAKQILANFSAEERSYLTAAYCRWETELEDQFAHEILDASQTRFENYLLSDRFATLISEELAMVGPPKPERILFIGSGPLPISAYHLHLQTNLPIDCLDQNPAAIELSSKAIERLGLQAALRIINGEGERFQVREYDLIVIALLAKPKRRILRNLRRHASPDCRILCRTSSGLRTLLYEPTPDSALGGFRTLGERAAEGDQTISTMLLKATSRWRDEVELRWLTEIDNRTSEGLLSLLNRVLQTETTIGFPGPLDHSRGTELIRMLDEDVRAYRRHVLVATDKDCVVGQLILTPHSLPNCRHLIEVSRGVIDPSYRGTGLAFRAFEEVANKSELLGCEVLYLDVRAGTVAAEMWKSFGFTTFGLLPDYARVGGKRYKGLFMHQSVSDLRQRLRDISTSGTDLQNASRPTIATDNEPVFASFEKRRVTSLGMFLHENWRIKMHGITAAGASLGTALIDAARLIAATALPLPAVAPERYGVGFMVIHAGRDADFVLVCWWKCQNELAVRVFTSPPAQPAMLKEQTDPNASVACVWDLAVLAHERQAWVEHILTPGKPDFDAYLGAWKQGEI